jgi:hypothetical protein
VGQVVNTLDPVPSGRTVTARLMSASGWFNTGSAFHEVVTTWTTTVADNGAWTLTLPASSSYDATNTWYRIDQPGSSHACVVPTGNGPFPLHDLEIVDPAAPACCPPPPAGGDSGTAARVTAVEAAVSAHDGRIGALETASDLHNGQIIALTAVTDTQDARLDSLEQLNGGVSYEHSQTVAAAVWGPIVHSLGRHPAAVSLFSADFGEQYAEFVVQHLDTDSLRIAMDTPTAGIALIS